MEEVGVCDVTDKKGENPSPVISWGFMEMFTDKTTAPVVTIFMKMVY